jgi:hypothetical protein
MDRRPHGRTTARQKNTVEPLLGIVVLLGVSYPRESKQRCALHRRLRF